jgi:hypothetical protein
MPRRTRLSKQARRGPATAKASSLFYLEMEATQEQPRKRIALNTACWDCYRSHRGCDGLRPCKRCVDLGRGISCRDPAPDERIPRKRKRSKSKERGKSSFTLTKQKGAFFIIDPQICCSSKMPSLNRETCFTSPSSFSTFASSHTDHSSSPIPSPLQDLDRYFGREIEPTETNQAEESQDRKPPPIDTQQGFTPQLTLDRPRSRSYLTPRQATRITMEFGRPPSLEDFMEELLAETTERTDHQEKTTSVFESLLVPDDMIHLTESFFTPFGLQDSTQVCESSPLFFVNPYSTCSHSLYSSTESTFHGLNGSCKNPTTRTHSVHLTNTSCSQQVHPFANSSNTLRYSSLFNYRN